MFVFFCFESSIFNIRLNIIRYTYWIDKLDACNRNIGGQSVSYNNVSRKSEKRPEKTKKLISTSLIKIYADETYVHPRLNKHLSVITKEKLSKIGKQRYIDGYINNFLNYKHTDETKEKMVEARKGFSKMKLLRLKRNSEKLRSKNVLNGYFKEAKTKPFYSIDVEIAKSRVFLKRIFKEALMLEEDEFIQAEINQETIEKVVWLIKDRCLSVTRIGDKINASNNAVKKIIINAIRHGLIVESDLI